MNNQACDDAATRNPRKAYTDYESSTYTVVSKPANKKSSPKQDLSEEKFTGSR